MLQIGWFWRKQYHVTLFVDLVSCKRRFHCIEQEISFNLKPVSQKLAVTKTLACIDFCLKPIKILVPAFFYLFSLLFQIFLKLQNAQSIFLYEPTLRNSFLLNHSQFFHIFLLKLALVDRIDFFPHWFSEKTSPTILHYLKALISGCLGHCQSLKLFLLILNC